jgi:hypothetical protein
LHDWHIGEVEEVVGRQPAVREPSGQVEHAVAETPTQMGIGWMGAGPNGIPRGGSSVLRGGSARRLASTGAVLWIVPRRARRPSHRRLGAFRRRRRCRRAGHRRRSPVNASR